MGYDCAKIDSMSKLFKTSIFKTSISITSISITSILIISILSYVHVMNVELYLNEHTILDGNMKKYCLVVKATDSYVRELV